MTDVALITSIFLHLQKIAWQPCCPSLQTYHIQNILIFLLLIFLHTTCPPNRGQTVFLGHTARLNLAYRHWCCICGSDAGHWLWSHVLRPGLCDGSEPFARSNLACGSGASVWDWTQCSGWRPTQHTGLLQHAVGEVGSPQVKKFAGGAQWEVGRSSGGRVN